MKIKLYLLFLLPLIFNSCYITNNTFYKSINNNSSAFVCYITNSPIIVDSALIDLDFRKVINKMGSKIIDYNIIELDVIIVDFIMSQSYYDNAMKLNNSLLTKQNDFHNFMGEKKVFYFCKKANKNISLKKLNDKFKTFNLILAENEYHYKWDNNKDVLYTFDIFCLNKKKKFDKFIRIAEKER